MKNYDDRLGFQHLTCHQSVFIDDPPQEDYYADISVDSSYEVWFKFTKPINSAEFAKNYGWLLDNNESRPKVSGLLWIPVKTSDNGDDVCLGSIGNLSVHYLHNPVFGSPDYYNMDIYGREDIFRQALDYLIIHPKETKMFLNSGLYADSENLDFDQKLSYVKKNGVQYLGMVGDLRGDVLTSLKSDINLRVVKLIER